MTGFDQLVAAQHAAAVVQEGAEETKLLSGDLDRLAGTAKLGAIKSSKNTCAISAVASELLSSTTITRMPAREATA